MKDLIMLEIIEASSKNSIKYTRELFIEYADYLGIDLEFQNFDDELKTLLGDYAPPNGCILLAFFNKELAGCVALRPYKDKICEMKRLYVRQMYRGKGIGKALSKIIIEKATNISFYHMRLDTLPYMKEAITLYLSLGFKEIKPYRYNPFEDAKFFEIDLRKKK